MARKPKSVTDIDKEIETLKAQRSAALEARAAQIGKIAAKADLTVLEISDADLLKEFRQVAERFRRNTAPPRTPNP
ncbi:TraC family protein [Roseovarius sp. M141]|uniref:TraC family protein n=1 Tax=Roseovarius sp. M141 TaxID=2583806 RepID=UPI0020CDE716|nr:TraC family protein [Roseovarius sp. M141]MCQ0090625.1 conjugal transfer protein [Roseovarius sp. M141]